MPARVLMQDLTGVPAVVDLAAMRSAVVRMGGDPDRINPLVPADLVIDHSIQVDYFGSALAAAQNVVREYERNRERYMLLRWAQKAFRNFSVVPPSTGIVHQVNIEYLASVVQLREHGGAADRLPGHPGGDGLPHHHGQRPGRPGLGRGGHRGGGRPAGAAPVPAGPGGGRLRPARPAPGRDDRHRPRPDGDPDAAQARRGGQVRGVLRPRALAADPRRPGHPLQHGPRVRGHRLHVPGGRPDHAVPPRHRAPGRPRLPGGALRQGAGAVPHGRHRPRRSSARCWSSTSRPWCPAWPGPSAPGPGHPLRGLAELPVVFPAADGGAHGRGAAGVPGQVARRWTSTGVRASVGRRLGGDRRDHVLHQHLQSRR